MNDFERMERLHKIKKAQEHLKAFSIVFTIILIMAAVFLISATLANYKIPDGVLAVGFIIIANIWISIKFIYSMLLTAEENLLNDKGENE